MKNALIIGSNSIVGQAISELLTNDYHVHHLSRADTDYSDNSLQEHATRLSEYGHFARIICCIGVLHNDKLAPEKRLSQLDAEKLLEYFRINAVLPALCIKAFSPLLSRDGESQNASSVFVVLSAMVGSISDNHLGGWYGYRSSKAALNMLIKTSSIEIARQNKNTSIVAMHPGTTKGPLSKPFAAGVNEDKYYAPEQSASRILSVADSLTASDSGQFFNWDGEKILW